MVKVIDIGNGCFSGARRDDGLISLDGESTPKLFKVRVVDKKVGSGRNKRLDVCFLGLRPMGRSKYKWLRGGQLPTSLFMALEDSQPLQWRLMRSHQPPWP